MFSLVVSFLSPAAPLLFTVEMTYLEEKVRQWLALSGRRKHTLDSRLFHMMGALLWWKAPRSRLTDLPWGTHALACGSFPLFARIVLSFTLRQLITSPVLSWWHAAGDTGQTGAHKQTLEVTWGGGHQGKWQAVKLKPGMALAWPLGLPLLSLSFQSVSVSNS